MDARPSDALATTKHGKKVINIGNRLTAPKPKSNGVATKTAFWTYVAFATGTYYFNPLLVNIRCENTNLTLVNRQVALIRARQSHERLQCLLMRTSRVNWTSIQTRSTWPAGEKDAEERGRQSNRASQQTLSTRVCDKRCQGCCKNQQHTNQCGPNHCAVQNIFYRTKYSVSDIGKAGTMWSSW